MKLSIVTTLYKSADTSREFYDRISQEASKITDDYEIIMVDDGSPDDSLQIALELIETDPRVRVIELSRNFGHHKAMMTGLDYAQGDMVFLIDVDLEEPPELLGSFYQIYVKGQWDVVYGYQTRRKGKWLERTLGAIAWRLVRCMLPFDIPENHSTVRLMSHSYTRALVRHKEHNTAIGGLWVMTGFKQTGVPFTKLSRLKTSYALADRLIKLLDSVTSFSELPLYGVFFLGLSILALAGVVAVWLLFRWLTGVIAPGWVSVMVSVWFLGGLAIFCIGVVGLYTSRIFIETKMRPYTIVRKTYNLPTEPETQTPSYRHSENVS
jgi:putative glycosyltransferase